MEKHQEAQCKESLCHGQWIWLVTFGKYNLPQMCVCVHASV